MLSSYSNFSGSKARHKFEEVKCGSIFKRKSKENGGKKEAPDCHLNIFNDYFRQKYYRKKRTAIQKIIMLECCFLIPFH